MTRESGVDSGYRNFGRLALSLIPWGLGLGAAVWLGVWVAGHDFRHQLSQEDRAAVYTGAVEKPKGKVKLVVVHRDCVEVTRADFDGAALLLYTRNNCHQFLLYMEWHWEAVSPNGTVIAQGYMNTAYCAAASEPGDVSECRLNVYIDDRIETLRVWGNK